MRPNYLRSRNGFPCIPMAPGDPLRVSSCQMAVFRVESSSLSQSGRPGGPNPRYCRDRCSRSVVNSGVGRPTPLFTTLRAAASPSSRGLPRTWVDPPHYLRHFARPTRPVREDYSELGSTHPTINDTSRGRLAQFTRTTPNLEGSRRQPARAAPGDTRISKKHANSVCFGLKTPYVFVGERFLGPLGGAGALPRPPPQS